MAKKQTAISSEGKSPTSPIRNMSRGPEAVPTRDPRESAATKPNSPASPAAKRQLCQDEIGKVAGEVWHALASQGDVNLASLKKAVAAPSDLVLAAIGWLAREGKLEFKMSGRSLKVSLR